MRIKSIKRVPRSYQDVVNEIDPKTMDLNSMEVMRTVFWEGNMTGIFSVTSQGMMKLFQQVKPTCFDDVAAVCALYRPGPLGSGMDQMYARRKNGLEDVTYDHPLLEEVLRDTYGCFVYQEHLLETCRKLCGMSWKDTNRVRKHFLKKDKSKSDEFLRQEDAELRGKVVEGAVGNGMARSAAEDLWEAFGKWGSYGFNRAHAKAYGMVTMQTAYLRTYYPMEFFAALLSAGQAADLQTYVNDIRRQGFEIKPVDVNLSGRSPRIEGNGIRLPFTAVKGIGPSAVEKIAARQPYASFADFLLDSGATKTSVEALMAVGAFTDLVPGTSVATLRLRYEAFRSDKRLSHKKNRDAVAPVLEAIWGPKDDPIELMERERELLGFNLRGTPFSINDRHAKVDRLVGEGLCEPGYAAFVEDEDREVLIAPLLVKSIKERPQKNGRPMAWLRLTDRDGMEFEAPAFAGIWEHVRAAVRQGDVYITVLHRKLEDPNGFVVGKPGWAHSARQAASYFIPVDSIEI